MSKKHGTKIEWSFLSLNIRLSIAEEIHYFCPDICWSRLVDFCLRPIRFKGWSNVLDWKYWYETYYELRHSVCPATGSCQDQPYYYCGMCDPGLDVEEWEDGETTTPPDYQKALP